MVRTTRMLHSEVVKADPRSEFDAVYARYRALPEGTKAEIVGGEIRMLPRPRPRHVRAASILGARLVQSHSWNTKSGPGGWVILHEPELRFGDEIRAPDLAGWRIERYEEPDDNPIELIPDWVCEVLSPTTARSDRTEKMPLFASHGVSHLWILDPVMKTMEVYRREGSVWVVSSTHGEDDVAHPEPFGEVPLEVADLWQIPGKP